MTSTNTRYRYSWSATTPAVLQKSPPFLKGGEGGLLPGPDPHMAGKLQSVSQSVSQSVENLPPLNAFVYLTQ